MAGLRPKIYRVLERCGQTHLGGLKGGASCRRVARVAVGIS